MSKIPEVWNLLCKGDCVWAKPLFANSSNHLLMNMVYFHANEMFAPYSLYLPGHSLRFVYLDQSPFVRDG